MATAFLSTDDSGQTASSLWISADPELDEALVAGCTQHWVWSVRGSALHQNSEASLNSDSLMVDSSRTFDMKPWIDDVLSMARQSSGGGAGNVSKIMCAMADR